MTRIGTYEPMDILILVFYPVFITPITLIWALMSIIYQFGEVQQTWV